MPDLTISDLKRALVEVKRICKEREECKGCPFAVPWHNVFCCGIISPDEDESIPASWSIDDWKEDEHAQTD